MDDDLPWEPLEAPDDGPNVYEGVTLLAPVWELTRPVRLLILVGFPGSGKSTVAANLHQFSGWVVVNQDTLGDRKKCVEEARLALQGKQKVVIDRCNISRVQRRVWLGVADEFEVGAACLWLDVAPQECGIRVLERFGHETLPAEESSLQVIDSFAQRLERPVEAEGFILWRARNDAELQVAVEDMEEVVQRSEDDSAEGAFLQAEGKHAWQQDRAAAASVYVAQERFGSAVSVGRGNARSFAASCAADAVHQASSTSSSSDFRYQSTSKRRERALYLRAVRRQVEYYFSDKNLTQDWFLHEKISSEPEPGWLEIRWLLQCPRIRDTFRADAKDVLDCLSASTLIVQEMLGTHWIRRGRKLPPLDAARPAPGDEPAWYKVAHHKEPLPDNGKDSEGVRCTACGRDLPQESFSKAQLTKHRKHPTCKDCVTAAPASS